RGQPSVLLARVVGAPPRGLDDAAFTRYCRDVARELYYGGHISYVLDLALSELSRAGSLKATLPEMAWHDFVAKMRLSMGGLKDDVARIVRENVERAHRATVTVEIPPAVGPAQALAWDALQFLVKHWNLDFGEARDIMRYSAGMGIREPYRTYSGDVFQRALI